MNEYLQAVVFNLVRVRIRIDAIERALSKVHGAHARDYVEELKVLRIEEKLLEKEKERFLGMENVRTTE